MPNKKINQLDSRTAVSTDLMLVGDPTTGTAYKSTVATLPLVPYTGATGNVNLGEFQLATGQVSFDQSPTGTAGVGVMRWNDTDGTLDLGLKGGNVTLQVGQEQVQRVVNKSGTNLLEANYQVVKVTDAQGQRLAVDLAQGNNDANSTDTIGIVTETINNNQEGFITTSGIIRGINTTGSLQSETWLDGDVLYLSPTTAGAITKVKPTAPQHSVILGYVIYAHNVNGKIFVKCDNGYELGELHDVYVPSPSNNDGIFWNSTNNRYENKTIASALGFTPVPTSRTLTINGTALDLSADRSWTIAASMAIGGTITSATAGSILFAGTSGVLQQDNANLFWDDTNNRLGIGTNAPTNPLQVSSNEIADMLKLQCTNALGYSSLGFFDNNNVGQGGFGYGNLNSTILGRVIFFYSINKNFVFSTDNGVNKRMTIYQSTGNVQIGNSTDDYGFKLDVEGTARVIGNVQFGTGLYWNNTNNRLGIGISSPSYNLDVSGNSRFGDNLLVNKNQNFQTYLEIKNQTTGTNSQVSMILSSDLGFGGASFSKNSSTTTTYKTSQANDSVLYNTYAGDISILNDFTSGKIKFAAGASSTAQMTLTSAGRLLLGTTTEGTHLLDINGTGRVSGAFISGGITINASAQLQIDSTSKGFLPPRMTSTQRNAIASPATGLVVYDTTLNAKCFYDGATWRTDDATIVTNRQTASYSLVLADRGKLVEMNVASANTLTIPLNSSIAFPIGTKIDVTQYGAGATTITATGGVTIRSFTSFLKIAGQYAACTLVKIGTDEWYCYGNLIA